MFEKIMGIIKSNKSWFRQLSYDIVKAHGGELTVETKHVEGLPAEAATQTGSEFVIRLTK